MYLLDRLLEVCLESHPRGEPAAASFKEQYQLGRPAGGSTTNAVAGRLVRRRPVPPPQFMPEVVEQISCQVASGTEGPHGAAAEVCRTELGQHLP
jgi:hypothetical protein